ncbi:MAG: mechanosensitive ion channel family protein [Phascolarctobacterium sp.]|nr:mechanosensitive ion channel family protein [Phascolarctobacterium sp.]
MLDFSALYIDLQPWLPSLGGFCFFTIIRYIYKHFLLRLLRRITNIISFKNGEELLEAFEHPINVLLYIFAFYSAFNLSPIKMDALFVFLDRVIRSAIVMCFFWGCYNVSDTTHGIMLDILEKAGIRSEESLSNIFSTVLRLIIVVLCFVTVAREWNYDISGFIASLSIGSVAVAFAAKDALANVFGSLIIVLDKPFKVGDWILANGVEGVVEKVSFRSTCVRTFPQELVYIPNSLLSNTPITNFTLREKRRLDFTLGLTYSTTAEQIQALIANLQDYLSHNEHIHEDDIRVHFVNYNDSSLDVRVTCYAKTGNQREYLDILNEVNLHIMGILETAGVSCAFPSQSIYFENPLEQK